MRLSLVGVLIALLAGIACSQQSKPDAGATSSTSPAPTTTEARPWQWVNPERKPFQPWHTDIATQASLYADVYAELREAVGVELPESIEVLVAPSYRFYFIRQEAAAKDGSLRLILALQRAMERLSFVADSERRPETIHADWNGGGPGAALSLTQGIYSPQHAKRMIVLSCDASAAQVGPALKHELVHAMQDQAFGFKQFFAFDGITVDETWARQAVEEGYAAMLAPSAPETDGARSGRETREAVDPADWSMRLLGFLYGSGQQLVERVAPRSESRHELLTLIFKHPPATTREVLHPELYEQRLDTGSPLELPETERYVTLRAMLSGAMSSVDRSTAWRSRLGEFGLQCVLIELGLPGEEAATLAVNWRNDELINYGEEKHPSATSVVWNLSGPEAAIALESALTRLIATRSPALEAVEVHLGDTAAKALTTFAAKGWPGALIIRSGDSVALVVGDDLGPPIAQLR